MHQDGSGRHTRSIGESDQLITALDKEVIDQSDIIMTFLNKSKLLFILSNSESPSNSSFPLSLLSYRPSYLSTGISQLIHSRFLLDPWCTRLVITLHIIVYTSRCCSSWTGGRRGNINLLNLREEEDEGR